MKKIGFCLLLVGLLQASVEAQSFQPLSVGNTNGPQKKLCPRPLSNAPPTNEFGQEFPL